MNAITNFEVETEYDVFTVDLPLQLPQGIQINEFEYPLVKLQQHIIDDLSFKLSQKHEQADPKLKALYNAVLEERTEILADRERANTNAETFRSLRNKAELAREEAQKEAIELRAANKALLTELDQVKTSLRHAQAEISGFDKLVENRVKAALATSTADPVELSEAKAEIELLRSQLEQMEAKRKMTAEKNSQLDSNFKAMNSELEQLKDANKLLLELTSTQQEQIQNTEAGLLNASDNYHYVMHNIDELLAYSAILAHENEEIKKDNLYLTQAITFNDHKTVWRKGNWQAHVLCKAGAIHVEDGAAVPHKAYGLMYVMDTHNGHGHTVFIDESGEICIPAKTLKGSRLPEKYWDEFLEAAKQVPVSDIELAMDRSVARAKKVLQVARLIDLDWASQINLVEIAQRLSDYVPEGELTRALAHIERAKHLAPRSTALINRINRRFACEYALHSAGGRIPDAPKAASKPKIGKSNSKRKKAKRK